MDVYHQVELLDIIRVDVQDMGVQVEFFVSQRWYNPNVTFDPQYFLPGANHDKIAIPWQ